MKKVDLFFNMGKRIVDLNDIFEDNYSILHDRFETN